MAILTYGPIRNNNEAIVAMTKMRHRICKSMGTMDVAENTKNTTAKGYLSFIDSTTLVSLAPRGRRFAIDLTTLVSLTIDVKFLF